MGIKIIIINLSHIIYSMREKKKIWLILANQQKIKIYLYLNS